MKRTMVFALLLCLGLASTGLAKTWTAEELSEYSQSEIEAMGNDDIQLQIAYWEWRKAEADARIDVLMPQVTPLRETMAQLEARIAELESEINALRAEIERLRSAGVQHLIKEGEYLWLIASYHYNYNDGSKWPLIYERNRDTISDPDLIYAGHYLWLPLPMLSSYTVVEGDYLGKIAGYSRVYGDRGMWPQLYEANRNIIRDPNLIYPGWVLDIPRSGTFGGSR